MTVNCPKWICSPNLLKEYWVDIRDGKIQPREQPSGERLCACQPYEEIGYSSL
ncbi:MAG: hypothetical protein N3E45_08650 [Oscillatoriaceae bacterium SKW80]|nr:hypothetical protein [Oscillatoriaceae bacterium SKYG93]MCX8120888.1 hypothetical protein [Oscillatoriaceae bacterium SKW80]MDW8452161.1 hypothetical protein [Oscillatoriaceae cyanobacterium SKYGB_i_bin93]HIK27371.1 hypothetical protein [Oscillatoriaceae cyanobacterium M7585_C2015_266]